MCGPLDIVGASAFIVCPLNGSGALCARRSMSQPGADLVRGSDNFIPSSLGLSVCGAIAFGARKAISQWDAPHGFLGTT